MLFGHGWRPLYLWTQNMKESFIQTLHCMKVQKAIILANIPAYVPLAMTEKIQCYDWLTLGYIPISVACEASVLWLDTIKKSLVPEKGRMLLLEVGKRFWTDKNNRCLRHKGKLIFKVLAFTSLNKTLFTLLQGSYRCTKYLLVLMCQIIKDIWYVPCS